MNLNANNNGPNGLPGDEERQMPLSFEDGKEAITVAPGSGKKKLGFGAMLFGGVALIAVVSLFSMRAIGRAGAADLPPSEAGALVDTFLKEREGRKDEALRADLLDADGYMRMQIARDELHKNPFIIPGEEMVLQVKPSVNATKVDSPSAAPAADDPRPQRGIGWESSCAAAAGMVQVQSAMVSSNPSNSMAFVNGQVLRVGETLTINGSNIMFTIKEVAKDGILLRAWNEELQREALFRVTVGTAGR